MPNEATAAEPDATPNPISSPELLAAALARRQAELDAREKAVAERERLVASTAEALEHRVSAAKPYLRRIADLRKEVAEWTELAASAGAKAEEAASQDADRRADAASADDQAEAAKARQAEVQRQVVRAIEERDALLRNLALLDTALDAREKRAQELARVVAMLQEDRDRLYQEIAGGRESAR